MSTATTGPADLLPVQIGPGPIPYTGRVPGQHFRIPVEREIYASGRGQIGVLWHHVRADRWSVYLTGQGATLRDYATPWEALAARGLMSDEPRHARPVVGPVMPADDVAEEYGLTRTTDLRTALAEDDEAERWGMHGDHRRTCWRCQSWAPAGHVH